MKKIPQTKRVVDERTSKNYDHICHILGVNNWQLWCPEGEASAGIIQENGRKPANIVRRQNLAREAFRNPSSELETYMDSYRQNVEKPIRKNQIKRREECLCCGESYIGSYKVCAPCLGIYRVEFM